MTTYHSIWFLEPFLHSKDYIHDCNFSEQSISLQASSVAESIQDLLSLLNPVSLFKFSAVKSLQGKAKGR